MPEIRDKSDATGKYEQFCRNTIKTTNNELQRNLNSNKSLFAQ